MNSDDANLTMRSVELLVAGWINIMNPPGSYPIEPEAPLALLDVLKTALDECGLGDRLEDVYWACHKAAEPRFAKRIVELEAVRQQALGAAEVVPVNQIENILNLAGGLATTPNLKPTRGTEREQHLPYKDPSQSRKKQ
jgi:hypothetical protein